MVGKVDSLETVGALPDELVVSRGNGGVIWAYAIDEGDGYGEGRSWVGMKDWHCKDCSTSTGVSGLCESEIFCSHDLLHSLCKF